VISVINYHEPSPLYRLKINSANLMRGEKTGLVGETFYRYKAEAGLKINDSL
jgi:hypothetical protein